MERKKRTAINCLHVLPKKISDTVWIRYTSSNSSVSSPSELSFAASCLAIRRLSIKSRLMPGIQISIS